MGYRYTVVGIGEILWDMLPGGKQLGGAPANFVYHAKALGAEGYVVSCVGRDPLGEEIGRRLDALKLNRRYLAMDPGHPTGTVDVQLGEDGKPRYVIYQHVAWDCIPLSSDLLELAKKTDAVCYGSLGQRSATSRNTIRSFITATPEVCLRVFDVNLRQSFFSRDIIHELLQMSNVLKISDEELSVVAGLLPVSGDEPTVLAELLSRYHLRLVALTKGSQGSVLVSPDGSFAHPGVRVKVADTVGAGDAFTAGVVMGLLGGLEFDRINDLANRLAAYVCSQAGATPGIPESLTRLVHP